MGPNGECAAGPRLVPWMGGRVLKDAVRSIERVHGRAIGASDPIISTILIN